MTLVDLVVFDIAGTTVKDSDDVNQCVQDALLAAGIEISLPTINATMGLPKPVAIKKLLDDSGNAGDVERIHEDFVARMSHYYRTSPDVGAIEGAEQAFETLRKAGIKVTLDTGFSSDITSIILERLGWDDSVIDGAVSSDEVERGRPYPDMIHYHMNRFGLTDIARVAKVGDAPADLNEGSNAGCGFVIGVLGGTHNREQLSGHPHTHLVDTVRDVPALILGGDLS